MYTDTKYIVVEHHGKELIFTFPECIAHSKMFEAVKLVKEGVGDRWTRPYTEVKAIAGGFVGNGQCGGKSESLGVVSRRDVDTALLQRGGS